MSDDAIIRGILANRNLPPRAIQPQDGSDWRSNMDVPGGLLAVGPRAPDTLKPGPAPTGSERVYDAIRGYLPTGHVYDRLAGGVAPVAAAFTTDAYDIGQDYAKTGRPAMLAMSLLPGAKPVAKAAQAAAWAGKSALGKKAGIEPMKKTVRLFHGTTEEGIDGIRSSGKIFGKAFFTPRREVAESFGPHVAEADVPVDKLTIDPDLGGQVTLGVDEANGYFGNKGWSLDDYIRAGYSLAVDDDVAIIK